MSRMRLAAVCAAGTASVVLTAAAGSVVLSQLGAGGLHNAGPLAAFAPTQPILDIGDRTNSAAQTVLTFSADIASKATRIVPAILNPSATPEPGVLRVPVVTAPAQPMVDEPDSGQGSSVQPDRTLTYTSPAIDVVSDPSQSPLAPLDPAMTASNPDRSLPTTAQIITVANESERSVGVIVIDPAHHNRFATSVVAKRTDQGQVGLEVDTDPEMSNEI